MDGSCIGKQPFAGSDCAYGTASDDADSHQCL
jgi:hypothetical protein